MCVCGGGGGGLNKLRVPAVRLPRGMQKGSTPLTSLVAVNS